MNHRKQRGKEGSRKGSGEGKGLTMGYVCLIVKDILTPPTEMSPSLIPPTHKKLAPPLATRR